MPAPATRPRRLALACALISAATLGTVSASAASASDRSTTTAGTAASVRTAQHSTAGKPPKGGPAGLPGAVGYRPTSHAPGDVNTADDAFAACMRGHGQKVFPAFHASKDKHGRILFSVQVGAAKGFDPDSKSYRAAVKACAPILKKAGITLSSKGGLPPLPVPGKPGEPGTGSGGGSVGGSTGGSGELPGFHTEKGEPGAPTLSGVTESA